MKSHAEEIKHWSSALSAVPGVPAKPSCSLHTLSLVLPWGFSASLTTQSVATAVTSPSAEQFHSLKESHMCSFLSLSTDVETPQRKDIAVLVPVPDPELKAVRKQLR